jgi:hypothetical protein
MVGLSRLERLTSPLSAECSNQLSYRPINRIFDFFNRTQYLNNTLYRTNIKKYCPESPSKGGDPAAGSPTATLLRLHPNHHTYLRYPPPFQVG